MDKKKSFCVIIISAVLAFAVALLLKPKQENIPDLIENNAPAKIEEKVTNTEISDTAQELEEPKFTENSAREVQKNKNTSIEQTVDKKEEAPIFKKLQFEEDVTKVEEASVSFDDPGIINDNGVIVVTRDFKIKSPKKYSFKDFGVLAEPPVR